MYLSGMAVLYNRLRIKPKILLRRSYRRILSMLLIYRQTSKNFESSYVLTQKYENYL